MMGTPSGLQSPCREVERGLAAELDDDADRAFSRWQMLRTSSSSEGLEEELVAGVVIGGDGFGVGIDHDGFVPDFLEGEGGVDAAVIELDALADAVRAAAEDHDFLFVAESRTSSTELS